MLTHLSEVQRYIQEAVLGAVVRCLLEPLHPGLTQPGGGAGRVPSLYIVLIQLLLLCSLRQDLLQGEHVVPAQRRLQQQPPHDVPAVNGRMALG